MSQKPAYKILFVNPPLDHVLKMEMSEGVIEEMGHYPPLGLLYLATYLKKRSRHPVEVKIVDCVPEKVDYEGLRKIVAGWMPNMCAITTFTPTIVDSLLTARLAKEIDKDIKTILGGHHVDSFPDESLLQTDIDYICQGEGERSLLEAVECIIEGRRFGDIPGFGYKDRGRTIIDRRFAYIQDLDTIPLPDRTLINNNLYTCTLGAEKVVATVVSSRGCPYQCTFCYCPTKNYRIRSVASIIDELKEIERLGIAEIFFFDDLFNVSVKRVKDISEGMLSAGIRMKWSFRGRVNNITDEMLQIAKKAGCERIHYGIETSSDDRLKRIKKFTTVEMIEKAVAMTLENGITTVGSFMIGLPGETKEEIFRTFDFMKKLRLDYAQISVLMPYPNTELYRDGILEGIIKNDFWKHFAENPLERHCEFAPQVWTEMIQQKELFRLVNIGYRKFYMRPSYVIKSLLKLRSFKEFRSKFHAVWILLLDILQQGK